MYIQLVEIWADKREQGHFRSLLQRLEKIGFTIKVPNPTNRMIKFLKREGFHDINEAALEGPGEDFVMIKNVT